jgi:hypothetical protein
MRAFPCSTRRLGSLCGDITVTAEDRRDTQREAEKTFSRIKEESAYLLRSFAQKVPRVSILTRDRRHSHAKAQRKTLSNAAALCVFAPLREKPSGIKQFLCKALLRREENLVAALLCCVAGAADLIDDERLHPDSGIRLFPRQAAERASRAALW